MKIRIPIFPAISVLLCLGSHAFAQTTWSGPLSGTQSWNLNSNWTPATFPNAAGAVVNLNQDIAAALTVNLNQNITVGTLNFGDLVGTHAMIIATGTGTNTLTFDSGVLGGTANLNTLGSNATTQTISAGIAVASGSSLRVNGGTQVLTTSGTFNAGSSSVNVNNGTVSTSTWSVNGDLQGNGTITASGLGGISINSTQKSFTGTVIANQGRTGVSNAGSITLNNSGSLANAAEFVINGYLTGGTTQNGGSVSSGDNASQAVNPGQRLTRNRITLNGGSLTVNGQALTGLPTDLISDTVANMNFNSGYSLITVSANATTAGTRLIVTTLERAQGASGYVRSSTLGGTARLTVGNPNSFLVGGGGAEGTTTMSIIPWLGGINNNANGANPVGFSTYGANGIRALDTTTEYAVSITAGATANVNLGSVAVLAGDTTVNSLRLTSGSVGNLGTGRKLTIASGGLFFSASGAGVGGAGNATAGTVDFGAAEGVVWAVATNSNSIGSVISGSGGLTKSGTGTLTLTGANTYTGATYVSSGTLIVGNGTNNSNLGTTGDVFVAAGSLLDLRNNNAISDTGRLTLTIAGLFNGKIALATGVNETVGSLFFGDQAQAVGTWGATGSGATNISDTYFSGAGVLSVSAIPEPATWLLLAASGTFFMVMRRRQRD